MESKVKCIAVPSIYHKQINILCMHIELSVM